MCLPCQAGYGISIAVLCILMGCYFKNARNEMKPPFSFPGWSVGVRLLIAPVRRGAGHEARTMPCVPSKAEPPSAHALAESPL